MPSPPSPVARPRILHGEAALALQVGQSRFKADWKNPAHRLRRLLSELIGTAGLTFVLSAGAAILALYGGGTVHPYEAAFILSAVSALWLVAAVYFLGDISAHFNPAMTFAFALRGDMGWPMAGVYAVVQLLAGALGSGTARLFFGVAGNLAATQPQPGLALAAAGFEAILTFGMVLMVLSMANGPKLNGQFIPLAVGAYVMALGTMGGPYEGAAMNPARAFGPDLARGDLSTWWVYVLGPLAGAAIAVAVAAVLRGPAKAQEAQAAMGTPLDD
ncbi:MAG: aquaporin [Dongiaceae bacterium]